MYACDNYSIEGEGYLYDGEKKKWPDPRTWNSDKIHTWMVGKHAWYRTLDSNRHQADLAKGTRFRNTPISLAYEECTHVYLFVLFSTHQLWKAVEKGEATDVTAILRKEPSLLEKHLDQVCVCAYIAESFDL